MIIIEKRDEEEESYLFSVTDSYFITQSAAGDLYRSKCTLLYLLCGNFHMLCGIRLMRGVCILVYILHILKTIFWGAK